MYLFLKGHLGLSPDIFNELSKSAKFEDVIGGRQGTVLISPKGNSIPIVRTTTIYDEPAQPFQPVHYSVIDEIKNKCGFGADVEFNNALIEIYDPKYKKMKYHSDQAIDLDDDSYICLFSCYENHENYQNDIRKLVIKNKGDNEETEIMLDNMSFVIFSTKTNKEYLHKIVLHGKESTNKWFGLTLRLSKTYVNFDGKEPIVESTGKPLRLAIDNEKVEFYKMRGAENRLVDFKYPELDYTISPSDLMLVG
jgi:hypothetical protein